MARPLLLLAVLELLLLLAIQERGAVEAFQPFRRPCSRRLLVSSSPHHHDPHSAAVTHLLASSSTSSDDNSDDSIDDEAAATTTTTFSKLKWKKKKFLLLQDVSQAIERQDPQAVRKAEHVVRRIQQVADRLDTPSLLDPQAYNLLIHAWAKRRGSGDQAERVLREMQSIGLEPSVVTYTSVMDAYANSGDGAAHAERIFFELLEASERTRKLAVNAITCDTVLNAWAQQKTWKAAQRAEDILTRLEHSPIKPTAHSYAAVVHGWAASGKGRASAERAQAVLARMLQPDATVRPDTVTFNAAINAWANSGDPQAGSQASALLSQMMDLREKYDCAPDVISYNSVLSAWSNCGHMNAAVQAEKLIQQMIESGPLPNLVSYNTLLHAWSKSPLETAADRAQAILLYLSRHENLTPDVYSYSSVLDVLAKSKQPDKAVKAKALLDQMLNMSDAIGNTKLSAIPFNTVLNACAFSATGTSDDEQKAALQVAVQVLKLMRAHDIRPDSVSYGNLLSCFANLMPPGRSRDDMALQIFGRCCEEGLVNDFVWVKVRKAASYSALQGQLDRPLRSIDVASLPRSWRRNIRRPARRQQKTRNEAKQAAPKVIAPERRYRNISEQSYQSGRDL